MTTSSTSRPSCAELRRARRLGRTPVCARWSGRSDGDQRPLRAKRACEAPLPGGLALRWVRQVHGARVAVVGTPAEGSAAVEWSWGPDDLPPEADAVVCARPGLCLAVFTADCAALGLASPEGVHAAVHVGWRGLVAGVVETSVEEMRRLGASEIVAGVGPCIHPCCYEFGDEELELVASAYGPQVRALTRDSRRSLDLPGALRSALQRAGARLEVDLDSCTACGGDWFSSRARRDDERQALFVWVDEGAR